MYQHTREGNSFKPTKICSLENGFWLLRYAGRQSKNDKRWCRKNDHKHKNQTDKLKGNREREKYAGNLIAKYNCKDHSSQPMVLSENRIDLTWALIVQLVGFKFFSFLSYVCEI